MKVGVQAIHGRPVPDIEPEEAPMESAELVGLLLHDADGQEDLYLGEIAKAEAGETILDLYNHYIRLNLFPDQAILEDIWDPEPIDKQETEGPGRCIRMTLGQVRQLLVDWLAAKKKWWASQSKTPDDASASSPPVQSS